MRTRAPAALGILLAWLSFPAAAPAAAGSEREFRGKRIPLAEPPHSQLVLGHPVHRVGKEVRAGGASFPVAEEKGRLRVAETPGGSPSFEVAPGKPVRLSWTGSEGRREVLLCFGRDGAGGWSCWAAESVKFTIAGEDFRLYDCDLDGRHGDLARDGWSTGETDQVVPLASGIPLGPNLVSLRSIDPDGGRIVAEVAPLQGTKSQIAAVVAMNRLRAANGLPPAMLDETLSAACTAHANYLVLNGWSGRSNPHVQDLGPRGASPEGARAAARSAIFATPPELAILDFWRTYYHRVGLMGPALDRTGVNAEPPDLAVVDVARGYGEGMTVPGAGEARESVDGYWPWADPVFVPSDGSVGLPTTARRELPREPVPNLGSRGAPLMAVFLATSRPAEFTGTLEEVRDGAAVFVPVLEADPGLYPFTRGIVPRTPLRGGASYLAAFSWKEGDRAMWRTIRFRTE